MRLERLWLNQFRSYPEIEVAFDPGFSVVTGEALALGKPVIATRCGGPSAFITPENGVLIEPRDDQALASAMIARTKEEFRYDPATVRRSIDERFSPRAVGERFMTIYQRVLGYV